MKPLCCITNPAVECKYCKEIFCADHGRPRNGINATADKFAAPHWTINQCRKRYKKWQLDEAIRCYEMRRAGDDAFKRHALDKKYGYRVKRIKNMDDRCDLCRSHFRGRNDRRWLIKTSEIKFEF